MDDLDFVLNLPPLFGDDAAEIEDQIRDLACEFFGSDDGLAFPAGYTARSVSGG